METDQSISNVDKQSGKPQNNRKRKKQYFNRIRQQMEFYFGDANLSKDRFLNKLLADNPCKFHRIKLFYHNVKSIILFIFRCFIGCIYELQ